MTLSFDQSTVDYMLGHEDGCPINRARFIQASAAYQLATGHWVPSWHEAPAGVRAALATIAELDGATIGDLARAWLTLKLRELSPG